MSYDEYEGSRCVLEELPRWAEGDEFYTLIMAAMRLADPDNLEKLHQAFPGMLEELQARCWALDGRLPEEHDRG